MGEIPRRACWTRDSCLMAEFGTTVDRALNAKVQAEKRSSLVIA